MIKKLYLILYNTQGKRWNLFIYRIIKLFLNLYYPIHCKFAPKYEHKQKAEGVIVSLTSFPARIESLWIVIETLLRQTYKPDKIILWLADTQFDSIEELPVKLQNLIDKGLEIKFCNDLRSHKKYYYSIKNNPQYSIITVDDDTFYPEDLVENLVRTSKIYPKAICCNLAHKMTLDSNGEINSYKEWESGAQGYNRPSHYLVPIGCEGVLYPPGSLNENVFDQEQIFELCLLADDLWLKSMATLNGSKAVKVNPNSITYANLLSANESSLHVLNVDENKNDEQLRKIIKAYPKLKEVWEQPLKRRVFK